jgi:hypothetical protein
VVNVTVKLTYVYPDGRVYKAQVGDSLICEGNG